jgi:gas vesicle protein
MASILDDTVSAAKNAMGAARENAGHAMGAAREGAGHAVASTRSGVLDALRVMTGLVATLRSLDGDDALGWIGLARRRSPLSTLAVFGAGMAVGTGVGMMLAPVSGKELRGMLLDRVRGAKGEAQASIAEVATTAQETAKKVEKKIETRVESLADKMGDAARHTRQPS